MHQRGLAGITAPMLPYVLCLLCNTQSIVSFTVTVRDETTILVLLEPADLGPDNAMYAVKVTGEAQTQIVHFQNVTDTLPPPLVFNASYHGLCYTFSLLVSGSTWSKPVKTITVLTKPLPVNRVFIYDYKPSPQTGVIFEVVSPENNVFSRVNISYLEAGEPRSLLYKDFSMGKTVFNHWLPGICYSNITFRLVSEASFNKSSLVQQSDVQHEPQRHRTVPNIPLNVSVKLVRPGDSGVDPSIWRFRKTRDVSLLDEQEEVELHGGDDVTQTLNTEQDQITPTQISTSSPGSPQLNSLEGENNTQPYFQVSSGSPLPTEEFVNEDRGSAMDLSWPLLPTYLPTNLPLILLELHWQPPRAPTVYDGFSVYIYRDGNPTVTIVDESTLEFFTELNDPGTYKALVATRSTSGDCEARESLTGAGYTFYLTPSGQCYEEPQEKPKGVEVRQLGPSSAAVSWAPSFENHNGSLVSVISLTCSKPIPSQRMESSYCTEENITSDVITNLTPGAQYRIVVHHTNGPLLSPPSDPFILRTSPTGIRDLTVFPLSPSAVILSWRRPYQVAFRKYILETFFFNPVTLTSQWSTYYEIAATGAVIGSVRMPDLLPAWFYTVRVTMETWGEPALRCCDGSTVSFITAPEAPHISTVDYTGSTLYMRWTYGDIFTDLTHSRLLHWQVVAEGRKGSRKRISTNVTRTIMKAMLSLPPGDIYNLTVTACTERSRNTSIPHIIRLDPAPPKSLYAVNTTQTSVSLLWVEEGVVDYYQVSCRPLVPNKDLKVMEPQTVHSHVTTVFNLQSATIYNCSVTSYSYSSPSEPVHISISTSGKEANPSVAAISVLAVLSVLLISLLVFILIVLRKKHLQMARECGAGTFINFASFERDGKLPYNWRRSLFAFLTLLPSCLWTDFLAFYINPWSKTALKKRKLTCPVQLDDFDSYVKDMSKDSAYKFSLQFEELKSVGLDLPHEAADLPANRVKNRYTNILPYDFSRVKLISIQSDEGSDYINANYIPGYRSPLEYIATQGPLPETRNDFWKMVLQQKSHVVVMLTQCSERRRVKCDHYWPFTDEPTAYGEITVEMRSEKESPEWTMRNFRLSYLDETQDVLHLNYTSWPDHGVPTVNAIESILQFVQIVRQHSAKSKGPIIVHCSAGVGRTGTFIALDRLMQHMREHEFVDILGLVSEMRSHRLCMVQTEEQYVFIHQCVQLMWRKKKQQSTTNDVVYENVAKS